MQRLPKYQCLTGSSIMKTYRLLLFQTYSCCCCHDIYVDILMHQVGGCGSTVLLENRDISLGFQREHPKNNPKWLKHQYFASEALVLQK